MTTLKTKQDFMRALDALILRLCAGEKCINESHICSRINRHDANTYSYSEIRRGLDRLLEKGLIQKLDVTGDVWRFLNEKEPEIKPQVKVKPTIIKPIPTRCIRWTKEIDNEVAKLKLADTHVEIIKQQLIEKFDFKTTEKAIIHRMTFLRQWGLLPKRAKNKSRKRWTKEMRDDLSIYATQGLSIDECAVKLSDKYERCVSYCAVNSKLYELRINKRNGLVA